MLSIEWWREKQEQIEKHLKQINLDRVLDVFFTTLMLYGILMLILLTLDGVDIFEMAIHPHPFVVLFLSGFHILARNLGLYREVVE